MNKLIENTTVFAGPDFLLSVRQIKCESKGNAFSRKLDLSTLLYKVV